MLRKSVWIIFLILSFPLFQLAQDDSKKNDQDQIEKLMRICVGGKDTTAPKNLMPILHPDIIWISAAQAPGSNRPVFTFSSFSSLLANGVKDLSLDKETSQNPLRFLKVEGNFANTVLELNNHVYLFHLVRGTQGWQIIQQLSAEGTLLNPDDASLVTEKKCITDQVTRYLEGRVGGEVHFLDSTTFADYSTVSLRRNPDGGDSFTVRLGKEAVREISINKQGVVDEVMRNQQIEILALSTQTALVKATTPYTVEYLHLFKNQCVWKIQNSLQRANPDFRYLDNCPVFLDAEMPDFQLPLYRGGQFSLSSHRGKKIMLVFIRGWIGTLWCPLCHYQYLEMALMEKKRELQKKYNLEIYFVLPYSSERIDDWHKGFKSSLDIISGWKKMEGADEFRDFVTWAYPMDLKATDPVDLSLPILVDAERKISKRFKLFTTFWDGVKAEQNISAIYILDEQGITRFKYFSQQTQDRPSLEYLIRFLGNMN